MALKSTIIELKISLRDSTLEYMKQKKRLMNLKKGNWKHFSQRSKKKQMKGVMIA